MMASLGEENMSESKLRLEKRTKQRASQSSLDPGQKMLAAFTLSMEARKLLIAGLRNQGFSETEILHILKTKRK
jgi:hypothetical protein